MSSRGSWQTRLSWIFHIRGKPFISRRRMLHLLWASQPSFPPSPQRKPFFISSTSSPVNLPICFYLLPDSPLPRSPYSWWTAQSSPPASPSPRILPTVTLSILSLRTCSPERGDGSHWAHSPWDLCGIPNLGYKSFPTNLAALPTPRPSLAPTGCSARTAGCAEGYHQRRCKTDAASLGGHPTLGHTPTHVRATFPVEQLLNGCITSCSLTSLCIGDTLLRARRCFLKRFCSTWCRDPAKARAHSNKIANNR